MRFRSSRGTLPVALVLSYTDDATGCGEEVTTGTVNLAILQTDNTLVVTAEGIVLTGSIDGAGRSGTTYRRPSKATGRVAARVEACPGERCHRCDPGR